MNKKAVKPVTETLTQNSYDGSEMLDYLKKNVKNLYIIDGDAICKEAGSSKVLNVALLGVALGSKVLNMDMEDMKQELKRMVKPQFVDVNIKVLELGEKAAM